MKKIAHTLVGLLLPTLLAVLAACHRHDPYPVGLLRADSLCEVAPDSARSALHAMQDDMDDAPLSTRMYHRLLCIKAADKADVPITSDSAIRPVLHYYEHDGGDPALLPEALYYGGRTYRELGDAPQALDYFDRAINALPDGVDDGLKSNIYSQRGQLFIFQDMYPEAREMFRASLECDLRIQDSVKMVYALRDIGFCFRSEELLDSAGHYYRKAYEVASAMSMSEKTLRILRVQRAGLYLQNKQYDSAWADIKPYLWKKDLRQSEKSTLYALTFKYYYRTGRIDSALYYAQELLDFGTIYAQKNAYRFLTQYATQQKNWLGLKNNLDGYLQSLDSVLSITHTEALQKANAHYNYSIRQQENKRLRNVLMQYRQIILSLILFLSCSALAIAALLKREKNKHRASTAESQQQQAKIIEYQTRLSSIEKQNTTLAHEYHSLQEKLSAQERIMQQLTEKEEQRHNESIQAEEALITSAIYQQAMTKIKANKPCNEMELYELYVLLQKTYPKCAATLSAAYKLNNNQLYLCLLLRAGFSVQQIAMIKNITTKGIQSSIQRICTAIWGSNKGIAELRKLIRSI